MGTVEEPGRSFGTIGHFRCSGSHPKAQGRETGVGRIRPVQLAHSPLHAHTFLFMCLACNVPIAIFASGLKGIWKRLSHESST